MILLRLPHKRARLSPLVTSSVTSYWELLEYLIPTYMFYVRTNNEEDLNFVSESEDKKE